MWKGPEGLFVYEEVQVLSWRVCPRRRHTWLHRDVMVCGESVSWCISQIVSYWRQFIGLTLAVHTVRHGCGCIYTNKDFNLLLTFSQDHYLRVVTELDDGEVSIFMYFILILQHKTQDKVNKDFKRTRHVYLLSGIPSEFSKYLLHFDKIKYL